MPPPPYNPALSSVNSALPNVEKLRRIDFITPEQSVNSFEHRRTIIDDDVSQAKKIRK